MVTWNSSDLVALKTRLVGLWAYPAMEQIAVEKYFEGLRRFPPKTVFWALDEIHRDQEAPKRPTISRVATKCGELASATKAREQSSQDRSAAQKLAVEERAAFLGDHAWWDDKPSSWKKWRDSLSGQGVAGSASACWRMNSLKVASRVNR